MKHKHLVITLLAVAAFAVGCNKEQTTSQQLDKVQADTKQAAQDMKDYTFAQKSAFVETMQAQLAALNRDLDQLSAKVEKSSDAIKAEAQPKLQALRDQMAQLMSDLNAPSAAATSNMGALFIASGPVFKRGVKIDDVVNIQIYNLLCAALGLTPAPNDGDQRLVRAALRR